MLPRLASALVRQEQVATALKALGSAAASSLLQHVDAEKLPTTRPRHSAASFSSSSAAAFSSGRFGGSPLQPMRPPRNLGITIVPERTAVVVERFGRFHKVLGSGLHILIPVVDRIAYVHSLKELPITIAHQTAITKDNVTISIDGVLYVRVVDPFKASYGVDSALYAVSQLAQTTMRSELGRITLDKTFEEREALNAAIVRTINEASEAWGLECMRYEIKDIAPPTGIVTAMALQAEAERRKRASILESEGQRQAKINVAEGDKQQVILAAEAEAQAIRRKAEATAEGLKTVAVALEGGHGGAAAQLRVAEAYVDAFRQLAKEGNTLLLPASLDSPSSMIAQAMGVFRTISGGGQPGGGGSSSSGGGISSTAASAASGKLPPHSSGGGSRPSPPAGAAAASAPGGGAPFFTLRSQ